MKKLPLGKQSFKDIINENYLYVDKTKEIYNLLSGNSSYYFLSRPRRFGKSLMVSTLSEIFSGNKELFKNLWIYDKIKWEKHPIIKIDFTNLVYSEGKDIFVQTLLKVLNDIAKNYNVTLQEENYKLAFKELISKLYETTNSKVVILIDEYDKPIIDFIDNSEIALENKNILKSFYEVIKPSDHLIKFVFLTGVSKFSKVSVFSGLNNLTDITLDKNFSTLLGYSENEIEEYFKIRLEELSKKLNVSNDLLRTKIKDWYNGYSWDGKNFVYNPYSILSFLNSEEFNNYWFTSGTTSLLIKKIKDFGFDIAEFDNYETDINIFESYDVDNINIPSLLFQTGYLTIKKVEYFDIDIKEYTLSYPNLEIKESLLKNLLSDFSQIKKDTGIIINKLSRAIQDNDLNNFFKILESLFASIPSDIFIKNKESYYHSIIYLILNLIGVRSSSEIHTNKGRIDLAIETNKFIYIFEFKLGEAEKALKQIEEKQYYQKYLNNNKKIILVGVGFSVKNKNIENYVFKELG